MKRNPKWLALSAAVADTVAVRLSFTLAASLSLLVSICAAQSVDAVVPREGSSVAYQPRGFRETPAVVYPQVDQVVQDLTLLRAAGVRGLVTYAAVDVLAAIPSIARGVGFDGPIVMGIWDPSSADELEAAASQAVFVDGYCVGNEGLGDRYSRKTLSAAMLELRRRTGKPVTTSEPLSQYLGGLEGDWLIENSDWVFPTMHPYLAGRESDAAAVKWVTAHYDYLTALSGKQVVIKETGMPAGGSGCCTEETQLGYFRSIKKLGIPFFYFEAFDQPFKVGRESLGDAEQHWGLYRVDGTPKRAAASIMDTERHR